MPRGATKSQSREDLLAISRGTLFAPTSDRHFPIPKRLRFGLRFFQSICGAFSLFLLGLQDASLMKSNELTSVVQLSFSSLFISLAVVAWSFSLYIVPM